MTDISNHHCCLLYLIDFGCWLDVKSVAGVDIKLTLRSWSFVHLNWTHTVKDSKGGRKCLLDIFCRESVQDVVPPLPSLFSLQYERSYHQTNPFKFWRSGGVIYNSFHFHHQFGSIILSHCCHIFRGRVPEVVVLPYAVGFIYIPGKVFLYFISLSDDVRK